jgi:hypothetical protein
MRIAAFILVILGSILTVTIVWLPVGLFLMGCGLLCGLIADSRASLSTSDVAGLAKVKAPRPRARAGSSIFRFRDASPLPSDGTGGGSFAFARRPNRAAKFDAMVSSKQAIPLSIPLFTNPGAPHPTSSEPDIDLANGQHLLPAMMSLLAQAVGHDAAETSEPNRQSQTADPGSPLLLDRYVEVHQVHHVGAAGDEWVQGAEDRNYWPGEEATDPSSPGPEVVRSSPLILKELAEMSAAYKENVEETEQLIGLLEQMSKPKLAEHEGG